MTAFVVNKSAMDITPFHGSAGGKYAATLSVKIKSAYQAKSFNGEIRGTTAQNDIQKDPADHNIC